MACDQHLVAARKGGAEKTADLRKEVDHLVAVVEDPDIRRPSRAVRARNIDRDRDEQRLSRSHVSELEEGRVCLSAQPHLDGHRSFRVRRRDGSHHHRADHRHLRRRDASKQHLRIPAASPVEHRCHELHDIAAGRRAGSRREREDIRRLRVDR
jgi:hypothetical protein